MRPNWLVVALLVTLMGWWGWVLGGLGVVALYLGVVAVPAGLIILATAWRERRAERRLRGHR